MLIPLWENELDYFKAAVTHLSAASQLLGNWAPNPLVLISAAAFAGSGSVTFTGNSHLLMTSGPVVYVNGKLPPMSCLLIEVHTLFWL